MKKQELTPEQLKEIEIINSMSRVAIAHLWRFAPPGHPYFDNTKPFYPILKKRFEELGGFSPEISKEIGWGDGR